MLEGNSGIYVDGIGEKPRLIVAVDFQAVGTGLENADGDVAAADLVEEFAVVEDAVFELSSQVVGAGDVEAGDFAEGGCFTYLILDVVAGGGKRESGGDSHEAVDDEAAAAAEGVVDLVFGGGKFY
jgi:hypothetical protein